MTRKTGRQQRRRSDDPEYPGGGIDESLQENEGGEREPEFDLFTSKHIPEPGYRGRLNQFLTLAKHNANKATFYLYRVVGKKHSQLGKWYNGNEIPDEHDAGLKWGSGDYEVVMTAPPLRTGGKTILASYSFTLDPYYDELRQMEIQKNPHSMFPFSPTYNQPPDPGKAMAEAMGMLQGLIGTIAPLITRGNNGDSPENLQNMFAGNYKILQRMMAQNMEDSITLMKDYQRNVLMLKEHGGDDEGAEEQGIVEKLVPYIKDWLPLLIGGGAPAKTAATLAKQTEMYKEIVKSRALTNRLIAYLDKEKGIDETDKVLTALGMKRKRK